MIAAWFFGLWVGVCLGFVLGALWVAANWRRR